MKTNWTKTFLIVVASLFIASFLFASCKKLSAPLTNIKEITLEGILLTKETIFVTEAKSNEHMINQLISMHMPDDNTENKIGALLEFVIEKEIAESYPMQATGISAKTLQASSETIKVPIEVGLNIVNYMPDNAILIDVRTFEEFSNGHIEGSINLPLDDLEENILEQAKNKDYLILLYCRSGNRSATAGDILKDLGYTLVFDLGGINTYQGDLVQ